MTSSTDPFDPAFAYTTGWWRSVGGEWYPASDSNSLAEEIMYVERLDGTGSWVRLGGIIHTFEWRDDDGELCYEFAYAFKRIRAPKK